MRNITKIRRHISFAIKMLEAARNIEGNRIGKLMRMNGGIALAEMDIDEAKKLLQEEMDLVEKLSKEQNPEWSVATDDAQRTERWLKNKL